MTASRRTFDRVISKAIVREQGKGGFQGHALKFLSAQQDDMTAPPPRLWRLGRQQSGTERGRLAKSPFLEGILCTKSSSRKRNLPILPNASLQKNQYPSLVKRCRRKCKTRSLLQKQLPSQPIPITVSKPQLKLPPNHPRNNHSSTPPPPRPPRLKSLSPDRRIDGIVEIRRLGISPFIVDD